MSCIRLFKAFLFLCSILSGVLFAIVWRNYELTVSRISNLHSPVGKNVATNKDWTRQLDGSLQSLSYQEWLHSKGLISEPIPHEELSYGANRSQLQTEANYLFNQTKVLCMVLGSSRNRSRALRNTWTQHCNEVVFYAKFADAKNDKLVKIKLLDDSLLSPRSFCRAYVHLIGGKRAHFDWLLITTDKTYAIVENLRHYLSPANASLPLYIGRPVHYYFLGVYNALDSGIVLSRGSVNLLANTVFQSEKACANINTKGMIAFDAYIGMQLASHASVRPSNSLDDGGSDHGSGRSRFHPFMPEKHIFPELISVFDAYWTSNVLQAIHGKPSKYSISFSGFSPVTMYFVEYLLYHLAAFTVLDGHSGIGNMLSSEMYRVPSDMDSEASGPQKERKSKRRRKKGKHKSGRRLRIGSSGTDDRTREQ